MNRKKVIRTQIKKFQEFSRRVRVGRERERRQWFIGLFLMLFGGLFFVACFSFLFSWQEDLSLIDGRGIAPNTTYVEKAQNWVGVFGHYIAHLFLWEWFGLGSFLLLRWMVRGGIYLMENRVRKAIASFIHSLFIGVWLSISIAFFFIGDGWVEQQFLCGRFGLYIEALLYAYLGATGAFMLLLTSISLFLWAVYPRTIHNLWNRLQSLLSSEKKRTEREEHLPPPVAIGARTPSSLSTTTPQKDLSPPENKNDIPLTVTPPSETTEEKATGVEHKEEPLSSQKSEEPPSQEEVVFIRNQSEEEKEGKARTATLEDYDPTLDLSNYVPPSLDLLSTHQTGGAEVTQEELISNKNRIVETLRNYSVEISRIEATTGPTVTLYEIVPAPGVRISKIKNLEDDIALSLAALGIRIIAPIPGKGTIGIEVPNQKPSVVSIRSVLASKTFQETSAELPLAIGRTISNEVMLLDLAKMPHILVAGATGQGKSVGINAIITSLLYKKHPSQIKFVLIDPKKVELNIYSSIENHFLAKMPDSEEAIITDVQKVKTTLLAINTEMDTRYDLLKEARARNLKEYNKKFIQRQLNPEKGHDFMPYIVVIIDEFADLIMTAGKEIEIPIARIAQLARAVGIHMVIATQRPSTNIITGIIKANFPARIAFRVASMIDSRTILDSSGANQLIGKGDMLFSQGSDLVRVQCAFIDTPEVEALCHHIQNQQSYPQPFFLPEHVGEDGGELVDMGQEERDPLFEEAARMIIANQMGSTSSLQRKFGIGYNRAGRLMDQLEFAGVVGPADGSKSRKVLLTSFDQLEPFLRQ